MIYKPTCQICYKFGHSVAECNNRFNRNFVPQHPQPQYQTNESSMNQNYNPGNYNNNQQQI